MRCIYTRIEKFGVKGFFYSINTFIQQGLIKSIKRHNKGFYILTKNIYFKINVILNIFY